MNDCLSNATVACGMILGLNAAADKSKEPVSLSELELRYGHKAGLIRLEGDFTTDDLNTLKRRLFDQRLTSVFLDVSAVSESAIESIVACGLVCVCESQYRSNSLLSTSICVADLKDGADQCLAVFKSQT